MSGGKFSVTYTGETLENVHDVPPVDLGGAQVCWGMYCGNSSVFFASMIGRMDSWLGEDGKGMMDTFNPAGHNIGVQIFGDYSSEDVLNTVLSFTGITDRYLLAMMEFINPVKAN